MPLVTGPNHYICNACVLRRSATKIGRSQQVQRRRQLHRSIPTKLPPAGAATAAQAKNESPAERDNDAEGGAFSQRMEQMTEDGIEQSGSRAAKVIEEAGFSEELKKRLEARITDSSFRSEHPAAFAAMDMPSSAGRGTQETAAAQPWTGNESVQDASLRMLDDAHKPLRGFGKPKVSNPIDLRIKNLKPVPEAIRLANARDKTSIYALSQDNTMSEKEREDMRKTLKARFTADARPLPATVQGLQSVASQRIEDAIARGQFKNIPRGKGVNTGRDHNADSPFIDTTEYFMNKIVKKQELTPPWIEKQGEIHRTASAFRSRLRADWKRHAARVIASKGGSVEAQIQRAQEYADAEVALNPQPNKREVMSSIDRQGNLTYLKVEEKPLSASDPEGDSKIVVSEVDAKPDTAPEDSPQASELTAREPTESSTSKPKLRVFRDPNWESLESSYHKVALQSLNSLTRSYNLMAPELAKKPYYNLERELKACFGDVAPQLPREIDERARAPKVRVEIVGHRPGSVLEKFTTGETAKVYDSRKPHYGFKEFWKDLFG